MSFAENPPHPEPRPAKRSARKGPPCRRFTLLDGMILVAGAAWALSCCRSVILGSMVLVGGFDAMNWAYAAVYAIGFLLVVSSVMILALRLRGPRPTIRRIARQPGTAACFAMVIFTAFRLLNVTFALATGHSDSSRSVTSLVYHWASPRCEDAYFVAIVWIIFALGRISRPEPSWIDRAGRVVGWSWIFWGLIGSFLDSFLH